MSADEELGLGPALAFLRRLWRLNHALERTSMRMERDLGLTAQQRLMIRCVGAFPGITPGRLAEVLCVDPGTVSAALRRLEQKGLVVRERDAADRRRVSLGLTARGRGFDRATEGTVEAAVQALLDGASPRDVGAASRLLDRLTEILEGQARDGG